MAGQQLLCRVRLQLIAVNGTTDLWADLSPFLPSAGVGMIRGRLVLCEKSGNFRVRVAIQTYGNDPELCDTAVSITTGSGTTYLQTASRLFVAFDPTNSGNGDISTKAGFRIGLLYSSTDATVSRGDVLLELHAAS